MIRLFIIALLFLFGCSSKVDCPRTEECRKYGACINEGPDRCVTGCERLCNEEGLCTPKHHADRVECIATAEWQCSTSEECRLFGRCKVFHAHCAPLSDEDCKNSSGCEWHGKCSISNQECVPGSDQDCSSSQDCSFQGKCFRSLLGDECVDNSVFNVQVRKLFE